MNWLKYGEQCIKGIPWLVMYLRVITYKMLILYTMFYPLSTPILLLLHDVSNISIPGQHHQIGFPTFQPHLTFHMHSHTNLINRIYWFWYHTHLMGNLCFTLFFRRSVYKMEAVTSVFTNIFPTLSKHQSIKHLSKKTNISIPTWLLNDWVYLI